MRLRAYSSCNNISFLDLAFVDLATSYIATYKLRDVDLLRYIATSILDNIVQ